MAKTRAGWRRSDPEARSQAWIARGVPISLVGDAPADIEAARRNQIRSISVATGLTPPTSCSTRADILLRDLRLLRLKMVED